MEHLQDSSTGTEYTAHLYIVEMIIVTIESEGLIVKSTQAPVKFTALVWL